MAESSLGTAPQVPRASPGRRSGVWPGDANPLGAHFDGDLEFTPPPARYGALWAVVLDTADPALAEEESPMVKPGRTVLIESRSVQVLRRV